MSKNERWREYEFTRISLIRLLSETDLSISELATIYHTSKEVKSIHEKGGNISDTEILKRYLETLTQIRD